jgi:hypothetical protein
MKNKELKLVKILTEINKFNESVAKNFHKMDYVAFHLKYCMSRDTLHSFDGDRCYNCSGFKEPSIDISGSDFREFKKHFGEGYPLKLIEIVDKWPVRNNFPYLHNNIINSLPEYKRILELHSDWMKLSKEEKLNDIFDISSIQRQYFNMVKEVEDIGKMLNAFE